MDTVIIREATTHDLPAILHVAIASYEDTFAAFNTRENMDAFYADNYTLPRFTDEFHELHSVLFVACRHSEVVGFVRLRISHEADAFLTGKNIELHSSGASGHSRRRVVDGACVGVCRRASV
ncbi:MAG: hypothetical protein ACOVMQ_04280 [Cyclobacteriaceae bacterium]